MAKVNTAAKRVMDAKATEAPIMDRPAQPMRVTVTQAANGGFIVKKSGGKTPEYDAKDEVYKNLSGVKSCMAEHFGEKKEAEEKDSKEY